MPEPEFSQFGAGNEAPIGVTFPVVGVCKIPIRTTASASDRIKSLAFNFLAKIIVKPKKPCRTFRSDAFQETKVLEGVHVNEAIQIHLTEGDIHLDEQSPDQF